jgi:hypothetical protein
LVYSLQLADSFDNLLRWLYHLKAD